MFSLDALTCLPPRGFHDRDVKLSTINRLGRGRDQQALPLSTCNGRQAGCLKHEAPHSLRVDLDPIRYLNGRRFQDVFAFHLFFYPRISVGSTGVRSFSSRTA